MSNECFRQSGAADQKVTPSTFSRASLVAVLVSVFLVSLSLVATAEERAPLTVILGAMDVEVRQLEEQVSGASEERIMGLRFVRGELNGRSVVIARTGVGKVNAAVTTTLVIRHYQPTEVVFTGIAGALNPALKAGDVVICTKAAHHDFGTMRADGIRRRGTRAIADGKSNDVFFNADTTLVKIGSDVRRELLEYDSERPDPHTFNIVAGSVVTGDVFVASRQKIDELRQWSNADAVEMEGAAVAQVCHEFNVPWLVIRSCSDSASEDAHSEVEKNGNRAASNAATVVSQLVRELSVRDARSR